MWVEPDLNLPDGESLVRQLLVGQRYFKQAVRRRPPASAGTPTPSATTGSSRRSTRRSGMDYFVTQKMHWNDTNQLPFRLFWWESPDGSKVLTYFPTDYVQRQPQPHPHLRRLRRIRATRTPASTEMIDLYGIGDHGGGPTRAMLDEADHWIAAGEQRSLSPPCATAPRRAYFTAVEKNLNPDSPTWNYDSIAKGYTAPPASSTGADRPSHLEDELYFEYHRGVFTTQANHKRNMRTSEDRNAQRRKIGVSRMARRPHLPRRRTHRKLEEDHLQPVPRPRRRLRHRRHLQRRAKGLRP